MQTAGCPNNGKVEPSFMDSLYFRDPLGQLMELACCRFDPPHGFTHADVSHEAHKIRVEADDYNITDRHIADALKVLVAKSTGTLSD